MKLSRGSDAKKERRYLMGLSQHWRIESSIDLYRTYKTRSHLLYIISTTYGEQLWHKYTLLSFDNNN